MSDLFRRPWLLAMVQGLVSPLRPAPEQLPKQPVAQIRGVSNDGKRLLLSDVNACIWSTLSLDCVEKLQSIRGQVKQLIGGLVSLSKYELRLNAPVPDPTKTGTWTELLHENFHAEHLELELFVEDIDYIGGDDCSLQGEPIKCSGDPEVRAALQSTPFGELAQRIAARQGSHTPASAATSSPAPSEWKPAWDLDSFCELAEKSRLERSMMSVHPSEPGSFMDDDPTDFDALPIGGGSQAPPHASAPPPIPSIEPSQDGDASKEDESESEDERNYLRGDVVVGAKAIQSTQQTQRSPLKSSQQSNSPGKPASPPHSQKQANSPESQLPSQAKENSPQKSPPKGDKASAEPRTEAAEVPEGQVAHRSPVPPTGTTSTKHVTFKDATPAKSPASASSSKSPLPGSMAATAKFVLPPLSASKKLRKTDGEEASVFESDKWRNRNVSYSPFKPKTEERQPGQGLSGETPRRAPVVPPNTPSSAAATSANPFIKRFVKTAPTPSSAAMNGSSSSSSQSQQSQSQSASSQSQSQSQAPPMPVTKQREAEVSVDAAAVQVSEEADASGLTGDTGSEKFHSVVSDTETEDDDDEPEPEPQQPSHQTHMPSHMPSQATEKEGASQSHENSEEVSQAKPENEMLVKKDEGESLVQSAAKGLAALAITGGANQLSTTAAPASGVKGTKDKVTKRLVFEPFTQYDDDGEDAVDEQENEEGNQSLSTSEAAQSNNAAGPLTQAPEGDEDEKEPRKSARPSRKKKRLGPATQAPDSQEEEDEGEEEEEQEEVTNVPPPSAATTASVDSGAAHNDEEPLISSMEIEPVRTKKSPNKGVKGNKLVFTSLPGMSIDAKMEVNWVAEGGPAAVVGVVLGDVVTSVNGERDFAQIRAKLESGPLPLTVVVTRKGSSTAVPAITEALQQVQSDVEDPLIGCQFLEWWGGMKFRGVVVSRGATAESYMVKYNDGTTKEFPKKTVEDMVAGKLENKHAHQNGKECSHGAVPQEKQPEVEVTSNGSNKRRATTTYTVSLPSAKKEQAQSPSKKPRALVHRRALSIFDKEDEQIAAQLLGMATTTTQ